MLVIFDLDGVLVDACEWHRLALNEALLEVANYSISLPDHYGIFNGIPTKVKLKKLSRLGILQEDKHQQIYELKQKKTVEIIENSACVRREKIELLKFLKKEGHTVACFTNSIRMTAHLMLEKTGIKDLFDLIKTNQDVVNSKPHPEGYLAIMDHFSFSPEDTLIIEDSPKGVEAAKASGAKVLVVKNPDEVNLSTIEKYLELT